MSSTNKTSHFELPQFAGADKPTMADLNAAFQSIDAALFSLLPRVNKLMFTTENVNPGTYIPNTTWVAWGSGRMPVGVDTQQTEFNTVEKTGGESTHTLTATEAPSTYKVPYGTAGGSANVISNAAVYTSSGLKQGDATLANSAGGQAHNNLPPYITCYVWKRTA